LIPVLEIGGTHVTAALVSPRAAAVTTRVRRPLDAQGRAGDILGAVLRCARSLRAAPAGARWGVAVPGPFDYAKGIALFAGVGKFEALYGVDVRAVLLDGLPGSPSDVVFRNDAHAFLAGEWTAGAARGHARAVGITLGTGVGSAFLADGVPRTTGAGVPPEGRMDLARIDGRPLEEVVSRRAILSRYGAAAGAGGGAGRGTGSGDGMGAARERGFGTAAGSGSGSGSAGAYGDPAGAYGATVPAAGADVDVREIAERARAGEERARRVLDRAFGALGAELGPRLAAFGATVLVVGGSMAESWDLVAPPLAAALAAGDWPPAAEGAAGAAAGTPPRGGHGERTAGAPGPARHDAPPGPDRPSRPVRPSRPDRPSALDRPAPADLPRAPGLPAGGRAPRGGRGAAWETRRTPDAPRPGDPPDSAGPPPGTRRLVRALLGEDAGLIGAAAAAGGAG
jgi:glucokinase